MSEDQTNLLGQAQAFQQQMHGFMVQKEQLNLQLNEIKKAVDDLSTTKEDEVYRISGPVLIKTTKSEATKSLKDNQETIEVRIKVLEKNEKRVKDKIDDLRERLSNDKGAGGAG